ncbi:MAG: 3-hydroxyacyl-CoA dehydrogenase family protein [Actinobacteria bacterium]|nr:MAG: 3-hydroxyacyl-CoA dehydrogenase family protein [Actinomycetota bacterium]
MSRRNCPSCGARYGYELERCTFCAAPLVETESTSGTAMAVTEVSVPSVGHEDTPYWCALLQTDDGGSAIVKLGHPVEVGQRVTMGITDDAERITVGVLGTGIMGKGLVELLLGSGNDVVWIARSQSSLDTARIKLSERLARVMDSDELDERLGHLDAGTDMAALGRCDLVIEAIVEELEPKKEWLRAAESSMRPDAVLATNTSGLPLDELAEVLEHPGRFGCLHFFNPATRMRLVEVSVPEQTDAQTLETLTAFSRALGKVPVTVRSRPAFVVNRVLMPLINEAVRSLEEEAATAEQIDEAVRLGLNHPMGPLELADLIGLDVIVDIMDNLVERTADSTYAPRPMLRELVAQGHLGRKTHRGFYDHSAPPGAVT